MQREWSAKHYAVARMDVRRKASTGFGGGNATDVEVEPQTQCVAMLQGETQCVAIHEEQAERNAEQRAEEKDMEEGGTGKEAKGKKMKKARVVQGKKSFVRPSLSSQLEKISLKVAQVTQGLEKAFDLPKQEGAIVKVPSNSFTVGKLDSRFPSPVAFFNNRCEYDFHHPFQSTVIKMVMYYADMVSPTLSFRQKSLHFRIARDLLHYGKDYDPLNQAHIVKIELSSDHDCNQVLLCLQRFCVGLSTLRK